jgi:hypothetical protein
MKLRYLAIVVALALTTLAAHAQVGLYINPIAIHVGNSTLAKDGSSFNLLGPNSSSRTFWGVDLGGYYDFYHAPNGLTVGLDLRDADLHANNASIKEFLVGIRVSDKPFSRPFKPYVQAAFGAGYTKSPTSSISIRKPDYRLSAGLDYTIQKHIDFRAVEVGYSTLDVISSYTVGAGGAVVVPASKLITISSGLVFRF